MGHRHHVTDHDDRRRAYGGRGQVGGQGAQGGEDGSLAGHRPVAHHGHRGRGRSSAVDEGRRRSPARSPRPSSAAPCRRSWATADQLTCDSGCPGGRCPEITVNSWATPRCVTGIPATAGTATGLVRPGITVTATPASRQASTSSNPRPKTKLSPPLKRTTRCPARARSTMTRLISSCCAERPRGSLATSMISTSAGSSPSSSRGASRSATTTSASISARRPATDISSGSPGPPPTSTTPGLRSRWCRAAIVPSRSPSRISSRTAAERRGSRLPSTATVTPACRPTAGVQAVASVASSARTQKIRRDSAAALTASLTARTSVAAIAYQLSSRSPSSKPRSCQVTSPPPTSPSIAGVTCGETTCTSAPTASSPGTRRCATCPPPTTTTRRPCRRRPEGYVGKSSTRPLSARRDGGP